MTMTPGYYTPNLMNQGVYPAYNWQTPQQSYMPAQMQQPNEPQEMIWVDGEVAAKSFIMPKWWPAGKPIPLWDLNEPIIYFKSLNQAGMPNPLQKARYFMDGDNLQQTLPAAQMSGDVSSQTPQYATKKDFDSFREDFESFKNDIVDVMKAQQPHNQSGAMNNQSNNQQRGNSK